MTTPTRIAPRVIALGRTRGRNSAQKFCLRILKTELVQRAAVDGSSGLHQHPAGQLHRQVPLGPLHRRSGPGRGPGSTSPARTSAARPAAPHSTRPPPRTVSTSERALDLASTAAVSVPGRLIATAARYRARMPANRPESPPACPVSTPSVVNRVSMAADESVQPVGGLPTNIRHPLQEFQFAAQHHPLAVAVDGGLEGRGATRARPQPVPDQPARRDPAAARRSSPRSPRPAPGVRCGRAGSPPDRWRACS